MFFYKEASMLHADFESFFCPEKHLVLWEDGKVVDQVEVLSFSEEGKDRVPTVKVKKLCSLPGEQETIFAYCEHPLLQLPAWHLIFDDPLEDGRSCMSREAYDFTETKRP